MYNYYFKFTNYGQIDTFSFESTISMTENGVIDIIGDMLKIEKSMIQTISKQEFINLGGIYE